MRDGAIVYSIPNLYRMIDRDGDGRADERRVLYGPFDYDDTHGMVNSLLRGYDGWIHAGHGFSNRSTVAGTDGDSISHDVGEHVPLPRRRHARGTAHVGTREPVRDVRRPVRLLLLVRLAHEADLPTHPRRGVSHFGRLPTGIGCGPQMMEHLHGSTAIAGVVLYEADHFPRGVPRQLLRRQRRDEPDQSRSARVARQLAGGGRAAGLPRERRPELPAGGHRARARTARCTSPTSTTRSSATTSIPLDDPRRDRRPGRIWRIVYTGKRCRAHPRECRGSDWTTASTDGAALRSGARRT